MSIVNKLPAIVSVKWLAQRINDPNIVVLDASLKNSVAVRAIVDFRDEIWIPGTQIFDFDHQISDKNSALPHMLPSAEVFTEEIQRLGINEDSVVVLYDKAGVHFSPRGWWMFRAMGHSQVVVLNGGLPAWKAAGYQTSNIVSAPVAAGNFTADYRADLIWDSSRVVSALNTNNVSIIDARSQGRFYGTAPEPREGLRGGHIPNSLNLPFDQLIDKGFMLQGSALEEKFKALLINKENQLVFSCGSGVTACILALGAEIAGYSNLAVYDGSWSEWGSQPGLPIIAERVAKEHS